MKVNDLEAKTNAVGTKPAIFISKDPHPFPSTYPLTLSRRPVKLTTAILGSQPKHMGQSLRMAPSPLLTRSPLACQEGGSINRKQMRNRDAQ